MDRWDNAETQWNDAQEASLRAGYIVMTGNAESGKILKRLFTATPLKLNFQEQKNLLLSLVSRLIWSDILAMSGGWFGEGVPVAVTIGMSPLLQNISL